MEILFRSRLLSDVESWLHARPHLSGTVYIGTDRGIFLVARYAFED